MNIPLFFEEIESFVLGFQMSVRRIPTITLNVKNDEYTINYTLCHELGHHVLGHKVNIRGRIYVCMWNTCMGKKIYRLGIFKGE